MKMTSKKIPMLSKSKYVAGLQCHLRFWQKCYNPDLASEISPVQQAIFDTGHRVGELATQLYPDGVLIEEDHLHHNEAVKTTLAAMEDPKVKAICEAGFLYDGVRVRADILQRLENGKWNLIEVKSSTSVKEVHYPDVAIQYYVLKGAGLDIDRVLLMHLNNQYVYDGKKLDLKGLFSSSDLTEKTLEYQEEVPEILAELKDMLANSDPPAMIPSRNCNKPYGCDFFEYCTKDMPEHWVMQLSGIVQNKIDVLAGMGIDDIGDIPEEFPLTAIQERIRACVANNEEYIAGELKDRLEDVEYPIHFLDFETLGLAIPRYAGTRPYQGIPFQWSDHILHKNGKIEHREYLCEEDKDPREELAVKLLDALGTKGSIFMYTGFEKDVIKWLAKDLPKYSKPLLVSLDRLVDLHKIIKDNYYRPEFHGSFSLKSVLPAILPDMSYENLAVQEGQEAGIQYLRMLDPSTAPEEKQNIKNDLLKYCGHDTLAMVKIREKLLRLL
jgi:CRISPR/Cas system-associated exonuclease Cas4 (RecB family)